MRIPTITMLRETFVPSLWAGVLGAPVLWSIHLQLSYALVKEARKSQDYTAIHLVTLVCFVLAIGCGLLSWRDWRKVRNRSADPSEGGEPGRTRFLSIMGLFSSGLFAMAIVAAGVASYFLNAKWD